MNGHAAPPPGSPMPEGRPAVDPVTLDALRAIRAFGDAHDQMSSGMRHGMHMNASDLGALRLLIIREEQGRTVSPNEIAKHLHISTASTTKLLDRLVDSGHVRRAAHPEDRRARIVELTDVAKATFFAEYGAHLRAIRAVLAEFSPEELDAATRVMNAVGRAISS